ncbi:MAG: C4-dicarboxylate transporter DctA [Cytophagaceae bacterium]
MQGSKKNQLHKTLYFYVLLAILAGVLMGAFFPKAGEAMKPLGDLFINLIKMVVTPVIFTTVVLGITSIKEIKKIGRIGIKAFIYFELITTLALVTGLLVVKIIEPGKGLNIDPASLDTSQISVYTSQTDSFSTINFILNIIPKTFISAFAEGHILQVLFIAILTAFAIIGIGEKGKLVVSAIESANVLFFKIIHYILRLAPVGAFGAIAFTVGKYGLELLSSLGLLMLCVYITCLLFIVFVLGSICLFAGFNIFKMLAHIKEEILLVLGTSSSESALPGLMEKMEKAGCSKTITGLVIPTGYSFNLDGTSIYLTMATIFIAQATNTALTLYDELLLLGVLMLTSKGAAAVTGGGYIVLAATLASMHTLPVAGIVLLLGVDRFMSEARAITNLIGNAVATVILAKWERELMPEQFKKLK